MQELGGRLLKLAGADIVSDGQATDSQEPRDHRLGNLFLKVLPDEIIFP